MGGTVSTLAPAPPEQEVCPRLGTNTPRPLSQPRAGGPRQLEPIADEPGATTYAPTQNGHLLVVGGALDFVELVVRHHDLQPFTHPMSPGEDGGLS